MESLDWVSIIPPLGSSMNQVQICNLPHSVNFLDLSEALILGAPCLLKEW